MDGSVEQSVSKEGKVDDVKFNQGKSQFKFTLSNNSLSSVEEKKDQVGKPASDAQVPIVDNRLAVIKDDGYLAEFESDIKLRINKFEE